MRRADENAVEWVVASAAVPYAEAVTAMEARVEAIAAGDALEQVWLLEHPPLYTAGVSAKGGDLLAPDRFPVFQTGRGGQYTYHGPGQRVVYAMLDLRARGKDVRRFVQALEGWVIDILADLGVEAGLRDGRIGVWVDHGAREEKIAAVGVKIRRWVSFHGVAINVAPDLEHFSGIVPCGITDHGVTSLADLGRSATMSEVDAVLRAAFERRFGPTVDA